jgi:AcrR family transcriptional regulator
MSGVADASGLARATVYNHVRDRDELLRLMISALRAEVVSLALRATDPRVGLTNLAEWIATDEAIAGLRAHNPAALVSVSETLVALPEDIALEVITILGAWGVHSDLSTAEAALRWLTSYFLAPGTRSEREVGADVMAASLKVDLVR